MLKQLHAQVTRVEVTRITDGTLCSYVIGVVFLQWLIMPMLAWETGRVDLKG